MFLRWFLILCATAVSGCGFMACGSLHQTAILPLGVHAQWWMLATLLVFGYLVMKVKK